jgi:hypothetical protein
MARWIALALLFAPSLLLCEARGQEPAYVSIVVKACPHDPKSIEPGHAAASGAQGLPYKMIPAPNDFDGQGEGEEVRNTARTKAERHAEYKRLGCIDVPVPPEVIMGGELTMAGCISKIGYMIAMQYLEQNQTIEQKAVGEWSCHPSDTPVTGVASF